ncbi:uncharacterized protein LOC119586427 [Penaeus monodon]|uniref:uncharacterized protein LOC119586427 n=1 Tax=Penaeus monodon TaxID=6687 RepID=UPI0018A76CD7|nr:uncharacterized protein LOC119586427 [Penaeus monodon]XP_037791080.1 uncharacterized protein LOC119586427 [Penaeus monodon]
MGGSVLHMLIEVSEHFQEILRLAAADGVLDSWGIEMVLQNVSLSLHEDDNFQGHMLFGLHSLLLLLARKLEEVGHEIYSDGCSCGWDTSQLPESQHSDIHRYTSGTVVRWVQGECYVLLASTEADAEMYHDTEQEGQADEDQEGKHEGGRDSIEDSYAQEYASSEKDSVHDNSHLDQERCDDSHFKDQEESISPSASSCKSSKEGRICQVERKMKRVKTACALPQHYMTQTIL